MPDDDPLKTSLTLLGRLRRDPKDQAAWSDFIARYGPRILRWCPYSQHHPNRSAGAFA